MEVVFELIFEFIAEFILSFVFDSELYLKKNKKTFILRIFLLVVAVAITVAIIALFFFMGINIMKENVVGGLVICILGLVLMFAFARNVRKSYVSLKEEKQKEREQREKEDMENQI